MTAQEEDVVLLATSDELDAVATGSVRHTGNMNIHGCLATIYRSQSSTVLNQQPMTVVDGWWQAEAVVNSSDCC